VSPPAWRAEGAEGARTPSFSFASGRSDERAPEQPPSLAAASLAPPPHPTPSSFAANHIDQPFLTFLFTLLSHENLFDHAAGLIEEVLSLQSPAELFFIGEIPDLYSLMRGFTCRQAAYFCRVLALLVFEPEDRQAMENSQVSPGVSSMHRLFI
jgi:hypothetical protein